MKIKMSKKDEKFTLDELFERYQKQSKIRKLSEYTIQYQKNYFKKFKKFINDDDFSSSDINMDIIDDYIYDMMEKDNKAKSINTALIALNAFCIGVWIMVIVRGLKRSSSRKTKL